MLTFFDPIISNPVYNSYFSPSPFDIFDELFQPTVYIKKPTPSLSEEEVQLIKLKKQNEEARLKRDRAIQSVVNEYRHASYTLEKNRSEIDYKIKHLERLLAQEEAVRQNSFMKQDQLELALKNFKESSTSELKKKEENLKTHLVNIEKLMKEHKEIIETSSTPVATTSSVPVIPTPETNSQDHEDNENNEKDVDDNASVNSNSTISTKASTSSRQSVYIEDVEENQE